MDTEFARIASFIREKQENLLRAENVTPSEERLELIAQHCQTQIIDPRDACKEFIALSRQIRESAKIVSDNSEFNKLRLLFNI